MRGLIVFVLITFLLAPLVMAYPQEQLKECMLGAKRSPVVLGVPDVSIENWCDCTLTLIVDEGKEDLPSANFCGKKYFK